MTIVTVPQIRQLALFRKLFTETQSIFFKFDLKNEYHNVGILTEHSEYLGFSCEL